MACFAITAGKHNLTAPSSAGAPRAFALPHAHRSPASLAIYLKISVVI